MDALQASLAPSIPQPSSRPSHRPDAGSPQPGVTAGESRMFQALGETSRKYDENVRLDQGDRPPRQEYASPSAASQPRAAPGAAPQHSCLLSLLRVMRCLLSHPRPAGSPQVLSLLALVDRGRPPSRRIKRPSPSMPLANRRHLVLLS